MDIVSFVQQKVHRPFKGKTLVEECYSLLSVSIQNHWSKSGCSVWCCVHHVSIVSSLSSSIILHCKYWFRLGYYFNWVDYFKKEHYRTDKKKKTCLRSQIYIKLTKSNDDDSEQHPLKYFCLKCHSTCNLMRNINLGCVFFL